MYRRKIIILGIITGLVVAAALAVWLGIWFVQKNQAALATAPTSALTIIAPEQPRKIKAQPSEATLLPRKLDGVLVPEAEANQYPIAIMIENAAFGGVRPQAGLGAAQVVYEVIVEGGITRLMAVYSGKLPKTIGPVRSARPTYLEFSSEYDALYAHAGGSPEALAAIDGLGIKDLSALGSDNRFFYRDGSKAAPHNLFTSDELLHFAVRDKALDDVEAEFDSWIFKNDARPAEAPTDETYVAIDFGSGELYQVRYVYDYATNSYARWNGGEEHIDVVTGETIMAKNVIAQIVPSASPSSDTGRINFAVTGEGKVYVARDGEVIEGTWKKADRLSRTLWYDKQGNEIKLNRGPSWIAILPTTGTIDYSSVSSPIPIND